MANELFQIGDKVAYNGQRFRDRLHNKPGWIHARVENQPGTFICEFPETANKKENQNDTDDYVIHGSLLTRWREAPVKDKHEGPEVQPRRLRRQEEE